jgi:four helix bundle protein
MRAFRDLKVWHKAHELTLAVYRVTFGFPKEGLYGLTSQIRRASGSIGANIAEGCGRMGSPELGRFLNIALGSASELEYHLLLAHDLNLLADPDYSMLADDVVEVKRMLTGLIQKLHGDRNLPET